MVDSDSKRWRTGFPMRWWTLFLLRWNRCPRSFGIGVHLVCQLYRDWESKLDVVLRQEHRAGEKMYVDHAGPTVAVIDPDSGQIREASIFVAVLGASSYTYAEATWTRDLYDWIGCHIRALEFFQGVPAAIVPDNWRTAVSQACWYEPELNPTYRDLAEHYDTVILPARVGKPRDKAKVESGVLVVERWILAALRHRSFVGLAALNRAIGELLQPLNRCCALLEKACREGFSALYFPAEKFFRTLAVAYADGSFDRLLSKLARVDVLAIDDWMGVPMGERERRHMLEVLEDRNEARSTIVTSQFPIETWHEVVGSPTLADAVIGRARVPRVVCPPSPHRTRGPGDPHGLWA